ncbi:MAG TPA: metallophosphoesterase, partial [Gemmataceae bacterium]|nr:metallophosphoesterase [Gemmataceae bacterium]
MPAPERILIYLRQAITLVRATPGRRGHLVELQNCTEVLVSGDLHGHVGNFQLLLKAADLGNHPTRHFVMQEAIHGTYRHPGGGDKSHQLVDLFAALKCQFPKQVHYIPGNHELAQWTGRKVLKSDEDLNALFEAGATAAYGPRLGPEIYQTYLGLFKALPVVLRAPNGVIVCHSLPPAKAMLLFDPLRLERDHEEVDLAPGGTVHSLLWGRDTAQKTAEDFLRKMGAELLVSGHIACNDGFDLPNDRQVIVDCAESPA